MSDLHYGWNPNLEIPTALRVLSADFEDSTVLLSMIDSSPDVDAMISLIPRLRSSGQVYAVVDHDVAIGMAALVDLVNDEFFTGFDEMWILSGVPERGKPQDIRITSDRPLSALSEGLTDWMTASGCFVGLGDGIGLNFVTVDERLAMRLKA